MRVMLLGSTGYVGGAVLGRLVERGHEVVAVVRPGSPGAAGLLGLPGVRVVDGEATDLTTMGQLVRSQAVDAVVHAAAVGDWDVDRRLVAELGSALRESGSSTVGGGALVYTSGVWVLGAGRFKPHTETSPVRPIPLVAGREAVEEAVLEVPGTRGIVIRPGIVHGRAGGIPELLVNWAREDGVGRYVAAADGSPVGWPMVHVDDLADLFVRALEDPTARGVLHAVDEPRVAVTDLAAAAAAAAGVAQGARGWNVDEAAGQLGLAFTQALVLDQNVEATAARALGWRPSRPGAVEELLSRRVPARPGTAPHARHAHSHQRVLTDSRR